MEKKIVYIGNAKNNTTLLRHNPKLSLLDIIRCHTIIIVSTNPKLITGSALIAKYLLSEKENKKDWSQAANGGWSK